jgi:hypothetical protein
MATNLSIDRDLIERALEVSGERTKKAGGYSRARRSTRPRCATDAVAAERRSARLTLCLLSYVSVMALRC